MSRVDLLAAAIREALGLARSIGHSGEPFSAQAYTSLDAGLAALVELSALAEQQQGLPMAGVTESEDELAVCDACYATADMFQYCSHWVCPARARVPRPEALSEPPTEEDDDGPDGRETPPCACGWPEADCVIRASGSKPDENPHLACDERDAPVPVCSCRDLFGGKWDGKGTHVVDPYCPLHGARAAPVPDDERGDYGCVFGCGPTPDDGSTVGGPGFSIVLACRVHAWMCDLLDARDAGVGRLRDERDEARTYIAELHGAESFEQMDALSARLDAAVARAGQLSGALLRARADIVAVNAAGFDSTRGEEAVAALQRIDAALAGPGPETTQ